MKAEDLYHRHIALLRQKGKSGRHNISQEQDRQLELDQEALRQMTKDSSDERNMSQSTRSGRKLYRKASLNEHEKIFLRALLVDDAFAQKATARSSGVDGKPPVSGEGIISDDILFSVPAPLLSEPDWDSTTSEVRGSTTSAAAAVTSSKDGKEASSSAKVHRRGSSAMQIGLWRAHEDGVSPSVLREVNQKRRASAVKQLLPTIPKPIYHDAVDEHIGEIIDTTRDITLNDENDNLDSTHPVASTDNRSLRPAVARNRQVSEPALREEDEDEADVLAREQSQRGGKSFSHSTPHPDDTAFAAEKKGNAMGEAAPAVIIENEPTTIPSDAKREGLVPDGVDLLTEAESCRAHMSLVDEADTIISDTLAPAVFIENEPTAIPSDIKREGFAPDGTDLLTEAESCLAHMSQADEADTIRSDEEVRRSATKNNAGSNADDHSENSSWGEQEGGFVHYDAWQVLKDEYAQDFGFVYREDHIGEDDKKPSGVDKKIDNNADTNIFKILGTSANDRSAQPHVMSPPLLESLMNFVPEHLSNQNLWLKYSLVRDGASIYSLRDHCKKSQYTFLALETKEGDVLGSFTSTPWHKTTSYYGTGESFLWKMRHSRMTAVHSLLEQAEMESEVDIFPFSGLNYYIQLCTHEKLAVGGGSLLPSGATQRTAKEFEVLPAKALERLTRVANDDDFGFGIAINGDMSFGTTSPCATFRNPSLVSHSSKTENFEIVNLEIWTFTPCETVEDAIQVEDMKFNRAVSYRATGSMTSTSNHSYESTEHRSVVDLLRANAGSGVSMR